jgi:hypothetical protein
VKISWLIKDTKLGDKFGLCNTSKWVFKKKYYLWIREAISAH